MGISGSCLQSEKCDFAVSLTVLLSWAGLWEAKTPGMSPCAHLGVLHQALQLLGGQQGDHIPPAEEIRVINNEGKSCKVSVVGAVPHTKSGCELLVTSIMARGDCGCCSASHSLLVLL